jgi:hypothetical protein
MRDDTRVAYEAMRSWKWLGLAGLVGVAAVGLGVVAVKRRRARTWHEYEPEELRSRLHARLRSANGGAPDS